MNPIQLAVCVPLEAALAAGRAEWGHASVPLDAATIARLSPRARTMLASARPLVRGAEDLFLTEKDRWTRLDVAEATPEAVVRALETVAAEREERRVRDARERAERQAALERARAGAEEYAEEVGLGYVVEEGYDVVGAVGAAVMRDLRGRLEQGTRPSPDAVLKGLPVVAEFVASEPAFARAEFEERAAPRPEALTLAKAIADVAAGVTVPDGWTLEVSRVVRFRPTARGTCDCPGPQCEHSRPITAVTVTLRSPISKDRILVVKAEP